MKNISPQSKSFIVLFSIAVVGTYVCLMLWSSLVGNIPGMVNFSDYLVKQNTNNASNNSQIQTRQPLPQVDTTAWQSYTDTKEHLSFLVKPGWKVLPPKSIDGFTVLQVDPGTKYYNIKIYISPKEFYVMEGLPTKTETIAGKDALNVNNALYGIVANNLYYTFDIGLSMSLLPDFDALVHSVKF